MNLGHHKPDPELARELGQLLRRMRIEAGLTEWELSERLGRNLRFIVWIEGATEPLMVSDFVAIVRALGQDPIVALREIMNSGSP